MNESADLLQVRQITRRDLQGKKLLDNVSLRIVAGERCGIVGPTGSGKSLLLRSLALLDPVDEGEILWKGKPLLNDSIPDYRRNVLYLHQHPHLVDGDVLTNLMTPFRFRVNKREKLRTENLQRFLEALGRDTSFLSKDARELSGGEAQIVAALRGIQVSTTILLLDEPTSALDSDSEFALERLIDEWFSVAEQSRAIVWVSHDVAQIRRVSDRILRLKQGRVEPA